MLWTRRLAVIGASAFAVAAMPAACSGSAERAASTSSIPAGGHRVSGLALQNALVRGGDSLGVVTGGDVRGDDGNGDPPIVTIRVAVFEERTSKR